MKNGVSAIIYDDNMEKYFLILHRIQDWEGWEFAKGQIQEGETEEQALLREIKEETGLTQFKSVKKLSMARNFKDPSGEEHIIHTYLIESNMNIPVTIDKTEHKTFLWTTKDRVLEKLRWPEEKEIFNFALQSLNQ